jgi:hypothetical protein
MTSGYSWGNIILILRTLEKMPGIDVEKIKKEIGVLEDMFKKSQIELNKLRRTHPDHVLVPEEITPPSEG